MGLQEPASPVFENSICRPDAAYATDPSGICATYPVGSVWLAVVAWMVRWPGLDAQHFMPGGVSWKPDIISVRTPLCQLREEAGLVRAWHRSGG